MGLLFLREVAAHLVQTDISNLLEYVLNALINVFNVQMTLDAQSVKVEPCYWEQFVWIHVLRVPINHQHNAYIASLPVKFVLQPQHVQGVKVGTFWMEMCV